MQLAKHAATIHRPAAIDVVKQHITTFTSMVAAGRRAGNGCVASGWRVEKANIVCVILQGSLQSLYEALGSLVCVVHVHQSLWAHDCTDYVHVRPAAAHTALTVNLKIVSKIFIFDLQKSNFFRACRRRSGGSVCTLPLIEPAAP